MSANRRSVTASTHLIAAFSATARPPKETSSKFEDGQDADYIPPWNNPTIYERAQLKNALRSRQHVNPLSRRFQMNTILPDDWPRNVFNDLSRPLFLDIGCAKGGFLLEVAQLRPKEYNYLGLEIRPIVVHHAQQRIEKHGLKGHLEFVGCNANVDLNRLLTLAEAHGKLKMVTIQFPDPHFKAYHSKRRVTTPQLVRDLAKFMPKDATVFLQSDVQSVLDDMRNQFREQADYFQDQIENLDEYLEQNIIGVPTEREVSVEERGLPVYRALFKRTTKEVP